MADAACFLCVERLTPWSRRHRSCCGNDICQTCAYRHITSILQEVGRRELKCPFGCGEPLSDKEIRECFHRQHNWTLWDAFRLLLYYFWRILCLSSSHSLWWHGRHSTRERRDLERYQNWSLERGLGDLRKKNDQIILQCPGTDCDFKWLVADPNHRRDKQNHETKSYLLWYTPYKAAENLPFFFLDGQDFSPHARRDFLRQPDPRRLFCPCCTTVFCGLCRNPWVYSGQLHTGRSCRQFGRRLPAEVSSADRFALRSARPCPGCQTGTVRVDGCNHMTCVCGMEWCYACGGGWNQAHYYCSDRAAEATPQCTIL